MTNSVVLLVSCGKRKSDTLCKAKDMYNSFRFQQLKSIGESYGFKWYIMSAKYGLLSPETVIEPYDLSLGSCSLEYKQKWAKNVVDNLKVYNKDTLFIVLADAEYSKYVTPLLIDNGYQVSSPFLNKDETIVSDYVQTSKNISEAIEFYKCIFELAESTGGIRLFNECTGKMYWPERGVYFFVDFGEKSLISNNFPRIVRVGTHAVSAGSKSTLWHRLKTHKGTATGGGNHRGSIFRLHVGNAIIKKEGLVCDTWGVGQNASKEIREKETTLEHFVSEYIGQLGVIVLDVNDLPSSASARSFIEKNSIALLSSINSSFNFSTSNWLGNYSPRREIIDSCLWNINYINANYDNSFLKVFQKYSNETIETYKIYKK